MVTCVTACDKRQGETSLFERFEARLMCSVQNSDSREVRVGKDDVNKLRC